MPSVQHLWIPGPFPSLNELLAARAQRHRVTNRTKYDELKQMLEERVVFCARTQKIEPLHEAYFTYLLCEVTKKRDPSNIVSAAIKIIEDGLRKGGFIPGDGWSVVLGFASYWKHVESDPGVAVFLSKHSILDRPTALYNDQEIRGWQSKTPRP